MKPKPRVGVLLDHLVVDNWEYALIERIIVSDCAEINVVVLPTVQPTRRTSWYRKLFWHWRCGEFSDS